MPVPGPTTPGCHTVPIINLRPSTGMIYSKLSLEIRLGSVTGATR